MSIFKNKFPGMDKKYILTDIDGVVLDWETSFTQFLADYKDIKIVKDSYDLSERFGVDKEWITNLVHEFNTSIFMSCLGPLRDAILGIKTLHERTGVRFYAITSMSSNELAIDWRIKNLHSLFGTTAFADVVSLDTGACKREALSHFKDTNCMWLEDKPENYELGLELGLDAYLFKHGYNSEAHHEAEEQDRLVNNWADVYANFTLEHYGKEYL